MRAMWILLCSGLLSLSIVSGSEASGSTNVVPVSHAVAVGSAPDGVDRTTVDENSKGSAPTTPVNVVAVHQRTGDALRLTPSETDPQRLASRQLMERYQRQPLAFVANSTSTGETHPFRAQTANSSIFFAPNEVLLVFYEAPSRDQKGAALATTRSLPSPRGEMGTRLQGLVLALRFVDANPNALIEPASEIGSNTHFVKGRNPDAWQRNETTFGKLVYRQVWPGVDVVFRGEDGRLKYDLIVAPGANVDDIELAYAGADALFIDDKGRLRITTGLGILTDASPITYHEIDGKRVPVESAFELRQPSSVGMTYGFVVGEGYRRDQTLVIDPALEYSTFLGSMSSGDFNFVGAIDVNSAGEAFVTVSVLNPVFHAGDFPTTPGAFDRTFQGLFNIAVAKFSADGRELLYSTYIGGNFGAWPLKIVADDDGNAYVVGETNSSDFPTTPGAFDTSFGGELDAFLLKLSPDGSDLVYSTLLGGPGIEKGLGLDVDSAGQAIIVGQSDSGTFPITPGTLQQAVNGTDCFITQFNAAGSDLVFSTVIGGSEWDRCNTVLIDEAGDVFVAGITTSTDYPTTNNAHDRTFGGEFDAFVSKISNGGSTLDYSTYLGGSGFDIAFKVAVDTAGQIHVTGGTASTDFPTTPNAFDTSYNGGFDAYVAKLTQDGSDLLFSTFLGGSADDYGHAIAVDDAGFVYVTGPAGSPEFPTTFNAFDKLHDGIEDGFVAKLFEDGSNLVYATFLGGSGADRTLGLAIDSDGKAYVVGETNSVEFPTSPGAYKRDGDPTTSGVKNTFVAKLDVGTYSPQLDGGGTHTVGTGPGFAVAWGSNFFGELCQFSWFPKATPQVSERPFVAKAVAGQAFSLGLLADGQVFGCGNNARGQLGNGQTMGTWYSVIAEGLTDIVDIEDGGNHSMARSVDGVVYTWGDNEEGQLCALADTVPHPLPQPIGLDSVSGFAGGDHHSVFIKNGDVYVCGSNLDGQLGLGPSVRRAEAPVMVPGLPPVLAVANGGEHTILVAEDPTEGTRIYTMGLNMLGQLCVGDNVSRNVPTATTITGVRAVSAEGPFTAALLNDGRVVTCGWEMFGGNSPQVLEGLPPIKSLSAGHGHLHLIDENDNVWAMGANFLNQLGDGTNIARSNPVMIGNMANGFQ